METRKWKLDELLNDFREIDRVVRIDKYGKVDDHCPYTLVGNDLLIENFDTESSYKVMYRPKIQRITANTDNTTEMDIPDSIACLIPYFIKGDLFQSDEPRLSAEARKYWEESLLTMAKAPVSHQDDVETVYGMGW